MLAKEQNHVYSTQSKWGSHGEYQSELTALKLQPHPSSRATRLVGDSMRFLLVKLDEPKLCAAREFKMGEQLSRMVREGIQVKGAM